MELKKGYKQTEVGVIPDDWKLMTIDQIFEFHSTSNYSKAQMLTNGEIGCFHYGLIHSLPNKNYDIRTGVKYFVTKQQANYEFIKEGDVVMVDASEDLSGVNKSIEISGVQDKLYISGLHTYLLRDRGFFEKYFRGPILNSHFTKAQFYRLAVGMKVFGVSKQQLKTVLLPIPTKSEQTAIANALSDTDAYITSLEKLIEKKRQIKQGAMQELLKPKDGWELTSLGNVVKINKGHLITDSTRIDGDIPVIAGGKKPAYFHNKPNRNQNTITISGSGASAGYVSFHDYPIFASDCSTIEENNKISIHFIYYFLQSNQEKIYKMQTGGAQPHIHPSDLKPMQIAIPSKDMQISIANILIEMDKEVSLLEFKLNKGNRIKQGMMQNLLTGKIRLI